MERPCGQLVQKLCQQYGFSTFLAQLLAERASNLSAVEAFLDARLKTHLPSYLCLPDISKAAKRLAKGIINKEKVALWGDYDVDGATSTALWKRFLIAVGCTPSVYIPDRFREGYGPNIAGIEFLHKKGVTLLVTLDCGTTAFEPLKRAAELGMTVIVVDHHEPGNERPEAIAIVNPKCRGLSGEEDMTILSAVGVSFFCVLAVKKELETCGMWPASHSAIDLRVLLDLVAVGTICDMVPLRGVNRLLVRQGMKILDKRLNVGFRALAKLAGAAPPFHTYHASFLLGPRLNAGSRIGRSSLASELLSLSSESEALRLAEELQRLNNARRMIEQSVTKEALEQALAHKNKSFLVLSGKGWHEGVIGIAAGRVKDATGKPVFVLAVDEKGQAKGSGRSVPGVNLSVLIQKAQERGLIEKGGGHAAAAGIALRAEKIRPFEDYCQSFQAAQKMPGPSAISIAASLSFNGLTQELWNDVQRLEPFGVGNPQPFFLFKNVHLCRKRTFAGGHLNLELTQTVGGMARAVLFRASQSALGTFFNQSCVPSFHLVATLTYDDYAGRIRLTVEDVVCEAGERSKIQDDKAAS